MHVCMYVGACISVAVYVHLHVCVLQLMVKNSDDALFIVPLQVPIPSTWIDEQTVVTTNSSHVV